MLLASAGQWMLGRSDIHQFPTDFLHDFPCVSPFPIYVQVDAQDSRALEDEEVTKMREIGSLDDSIKPWLDDFWTVT